MLTKGHYPQIKDKNPQISHKIYLGLDFDLVIYAELGYFHICVVNSVLLFHHRSRKNKMMEGWIHRQKPIVPVGPFHL